MLIDGPACSKRCVSSYVDALRQVVARHQARDHAGLGGGALRGEHSPVGCLHHVAAAAGRRGSNAESCSGAPPTCPVYLAIGP